MKKSIAVFLFIGTLFSVCIALSHASILCAQIEGNIWLKSRVSPDPDNPTLLEEDLTDSEHYPTELTSYYYKTMSSIYQYHVISVLPFQTTPNVSLYLYSDSGYSNEVGVSRRLADALEWVVFKGSATVYPKVSVGFGGDAWARVQWDGASRLYERDIVSNTVNISDFVDIYTFTLFYTNTYNLTLTVPATGDFDLYLYYLGVSTAAGPEEYLTRSATNQTGVSESISQYSPTPTTSGDYVALIVWTAGNGTYSFTFEQLAGNGDGQPPIPAFGFIFSVLAVVGGGVLVQRLQWRSKRGW